MEERAAHGAVVSAIRDIVVGYAEHHELDQSTAIMLIADPQAARDQARR